MIEVFAIVSFFANFFFAYIITKSWKQNERLSLEKDDNFNALAVLKYKYYALCDKAYVRQGRAFVKYN